MARVAVLGATGRMGAALIEAIRDNGELTLSGALTRADHPALGTPFQGTQVSLTDDPAAALRDADIAVDFALRDGLAARARACKDAGCPWLVGTTGLSAAERDLLRDASAGVPVLLSANTALAVNACFASAAGLARVLGERYDIDIVDTHHRGKKDAPSGTALEFGRAIAAARGKRLEELRWHDDGQRCRPPGRIAFTALRAGQHAGEHCIRFSGEKDYVELVHRVAERSVFALGALAAARWLATQPAGLYGMGDFVDAESVA